MSLSMSYEDLEYEVKRLRQKCEVLESNYKIVLEERQIASEIKGSTAVQNERENELLQTIKKLKALNSMSIQKYNVVQRHLFLEKSALGDMKREMTNNVALVIDTVKHNVTILANKIVENQQKYQSSYDEMNKALNAMKDKNHSLQAKLRPYEMNAKQYKSEIEKERETMKSYVVSITKKIEMYQLEHAEEVIKLTNEINDKNNYQLEMEQKNKQYEIEMKSLKEQMMQLQSNYNLIEIENKTILGTLNK